MIKSLSKNIIDVKTFGLAVKTVKSYGQTVWERVKPTPVEFGGLKFTSLEAGEIGMTHNGTNATTNKPSLSYSKNGGEWVEWDYTNIPVVKDDVVYLKGINDKFSKSKSDYSTFTSTCKISASGNIMSLLYGDDYEGKLSLSGKGYCFYKLFEGCTSLTTAPELPATTVEGYCYKNMFYGCTSLTTAPELPAKTLSDYCYDCYSYMFYGCTSLTTAPALPATKLSNSCYVDMFYGCTSLTTAPALPATELESNCYENMFYGCTSLTTAPELPATSLYSRCYSSMFGKCTSLTTAPELPATKLTNYCYQYMFYGCTSLTTAPELHATKLTNYCYSNMFSGCTSLVNAPELPATELVNNCYLGMFNGCTKLNYVKANFLTEPSSTYTSNWLSRVSSKGTFVPNPDATWPSTIERNSTTVPSGWTIHEEYKGLTFTAMEDGCSITYQNSDKTSAEYSKDGVNWESYNGSSDGSISSYVGIRLNKGEKLYVRGTIDPAGQSLAKHTKFVINGKVEASGNINSLNNNSDVLPPSAYADLFNGCTSLMSAPELPSVNLSSQCYYRIFKGCTNLNYIKANFITDPSDNNNKYTYEWLDGVALIGTFVANPEATWTDTVTRGTSTVPENWTIQK